MPAPQCSLAKQTSVSLVQHAGLTKPHVRARVYLCVCALATLLENGDKTEELHVDSTISPIFLGIALARESVCTLWRGAMPPFVVGTATSIARHYNTEEPNLVFPRMRTIREASLVTK